MKDENNVAKNRKIHYSFRGICFCSPLTRVHKNRLSTFKSSITCIPCRVKLSKRKHD